MAHKGRFDLSLEKGSVSAFSLAGALLIIKSNSSGEIFLSSCGVD